MSVPTGQVIYYFGGIPMTQETSNLWCSELRHFTDWTQTSTTSPYPVLLAIVEWSLSGYHGTTDPRSSRIHEVWQQIPSMTLRLCVVEDMRVSHGSMLISKISSWHSYISLSIFDVSTWASFLNELMLHICPMVSSGYPHDIPILVGCTHEKHRSDPGLQVTRHTQSCDGSLTHL